MQRSTWEAKSGKDRYQVSFLHCGSSTSLSASGELTHDGRCHAGIQWSFINNSLQSQNYSRTAKGSSSLDRLYSRKIRKQLVHHKQVRDL